MENRAHDDLGGLSDGWESRCIPLVDRATALAANSRELRRISEQIDERAVL